MGTSRRDFLTTAATAAGAAATQNLTHAKEQEHGHEHQAVPSDLTLRVKSLESLLVEKGLVDRAALDALIDTYEHKVGPRNGARVVRRAWVDPAYKQRLLTDADAAIAELGYGGMQGEHMVAIENSSRVHNLVVCTLCSCYPWPVLGLPPVWYKSASRNTPAAPKFRVSQRVRARNINPTGHTRLPRYARGKLGTIEGDHGVFVFPDTNAHFLGEKPQHVYSVRFAARELWGEQARPQDAIYVNLWDDHLDPA
jgi:hypothetical protein